MKSLNDCLWIGGDEASQSPVIVRRFTVKDVKSTMLSITGIGYFEAKINGVPVTEYRFLPVVSDYEPRNLKEFNYPLNDITVNRIYYYEFDITRLINAGENILTIQLGNGFYRQNERIAEGDVSFGNILKTVYKIEVGENCICSDGSETYFDSEIKYNNLFYGEVVDAAAIKSERRVNILPAPNTMLTLAKGTPDKVVKTIKPKKIDDTVYDVGENISGIVRVKTSAKKGEKIILRFAENINSDGTLNFISTGSDYISTTGKHQIQEDVFICNGNEYTFEPKFVWHAFRYFDIEGNFDSLEVLVIHSNTSVTSEFSCDCEGLQFLYDAFIRTQLNNMHGSIPSDCPHRERLGYTGDGQVCAPAAMMMLDSRDFYEKWIQDILDCQDKISGHVQHTAPLMGGGGGPGGWGSAIVHVPYAFYKQYGELSMLEKCYIPMRKWIKYLEEHCENGIVVREEEGGWCLGDWAALNGVSIPSEYVNSCYFVKNLLIMEEVAHLLGFVTDVTEYISLRKRTEEAIIKEFYSNGTFANGAQAADAYAVWCGLAGEDAACRVAEKYEALGHFDTGFLGTDILVQVLFDYGYEDVALKLLENDELGSFLYMKRNGATTIWEYWDAGKSHDHPMFGACSRQLFTSILGIRQREGTAGYSDIIIDPRLPTNLNHASGSIMTPKGRISVSWEKQNGEFTLKVDVPEEIKVGCK